MSTSTTTCIEVNPDSVEITSADIALVGSNAHCVNPEEKTSIVEGYKNEYSIIGDGLYASVSSDDAPQWLLGLIDNVVSSSIASGFSSYDLLVQDVRNAIASIDVAANKYVEQININSIVDGIVATHLTTLNATFGNTYATIVDLDTAVATVDYSLVSRITDLKAQFTDDINSQITTIQTTYAAADTAIANDVTALTSTIDNTIVPGLSASATAISGLQTFVGVDGDNNPLTSGLAYRVNLLEKQTDGLIEFYTSTTDCMSGVTDPNTNTSDDVLEVTVEPYATWIAADTANGNEEVRSAHVGDVYVLYSINAETGIKTYIRSYKFIKTAPDQDSTNSTDAEGYTWALITDTDAQQAYVIALEAKDLADGKRRVFVDLGSDNTPTPPYDVGDLWLVDVDQTINGVTAKIGDIFRAIEAKGNIGTYEANDWVVASSYNIALAAEAQALEDWKTGVYSTFVTTIQEQVDSKAESFYQNTAPRPEGTDETYAIWVGDLWKDPTNNNEYIYQYIDGITGYGWVQIEIPDSVFDTIDTKKTIFTGNTVPTGTALNPVQLNDMWITGDSPTNYKANSIYVCTNVGNPFGNPVVLPVWTIPVKYTDDQYAIDIENGTRQIDLSNHINSLGWQTSSEVNSITSGVLSTWITNTYDTDQLSVQSTLDGKVEAYFQEEQPYDPKTASEAKNGDLWYKINSKLLYRYNYSTTSWDRIYDQEALNAASAASTAQITADGKVTTFISNTAPIAEGDGDIWINTTYNNGFYFWNAANREWVYVRDTTKDEDIITALQRASSAQATADGKIVSFFQDIEPTSADLGDIWFNTANGNLIYIYEETENGTFEWVNRQDSAIGTALQNASNAQATADGKIITYYQDTAPTENLTIGDLWVNTTNGINKVHRYNGTSWDYFRDDSALDDFITVTYAKDLLDIGEQIDGKADTYFQGSEPYSFNSLTESEKALYEGDVWYDTTPANGIEAYRFSSTNGWVLIQDTRTLEALSAASTAQATADGKIRNFTSQPIAPYSVGDTWMQGITGNIYVCNTDNDIGVFNAAHWELASKYTDDSAVTLLNTGLTNGTVAINLSSATIDGTKNITTYINTQIDAQVVVYSGVNVNTAPTGKNDDLFIENKEVTDSAGNKYTETTIYKWVTSRWVAQTNASSSIANLADLADGKRTIYSNASNNIPNGEENDIWIPTNGTDNTTYIPGEVYQYLNNIWTLATKYTEDLNDFVSTIYDPDSAQLHRQLDGKVEHYFFESYNVDNTAFPALDFTVIANEAAALALISGTYTTQELKDEANGNIVYFKDSTNAYWYSENTNSWLAITDTSIYEALQDAANAQASADGKVSQFYAWGGANAPADYIMNPSDPVEDQVTIDGDNFQYWYKADGNLYYKPDAAWVVMPTSANSAVYIASGDLLTVFDPTTGDNTAYNYNGTSWQQIGPTGIISKSSYFVDLENEVTGPTGHVATSLAALSVDSKAYADDIGTSVENKFEYDSTVTINGVAYTAGFGLVNSATAVVGKPTVEGESEFWINADKFKFTNSSNTGTNAPFSIDATGTAPEITFNGKVTFGSGQTGTIDEAIAALVDVSGDISSNNDAFAQKLGYANYSELVNAAQAGNTIISGGLIRTELIQAANIAAISADGNLGTITAGILTSGDNSFVIDLNNKTITISV